MKLWKRILPQLSALCPLVMASGSVVGAETDVHLLLHRLLSNETFNGGVYDPTQLRAQGCLRIVFPSTLRALRESIQVICQLVVSRPVNRKAELKWKLTGSHLERGSGVNTLKVKLLLGMCSPPITVSAGIRQEEIRNVG